MPARTPLLSMAIASASVAMAAAALPADGGRTARPPTPRSSSADVSGKSGWQVVLYQSCRFSVPASWREDGDRSVVRAPDGSSLSVRMMQNVRWPLHKAQIRAAYGFLKVVHEDSDRRLWFEIGEAPRVQHYIAVVDGSTICAGILEVHSSTPTDRAEVVRTIAESLGRSATSGTAAGPVRRQ